MKALIGKAQHVVVHTTVSHQDEQLKASKQLKKGR